MDNFFSWFEAPLNAIADTGPPQWVMLVLALVMFGGWTATYLAIILKSRKDKAYGIPFPNTCLNFSWELIFSFDLMGGLPPFFFPLRVGHLFWLLPNTLNVIQTWKYGPDMQKTEWMKARFRKYLAATFVLCFALLYTFQQYAYDVFGVASSWMINVFMSWLFIRMLLDRRNLVAADGTIRGMSVRAAYFKLIGNAAGVIFCFYWWPAQFTSGVLMHNGMTISEPPTYAFLYLVYALNLALDVVLIRMLKKVEREIRSGQPVVPVSTA